MLVDGQVVHGMAQEGFLIHDRYCLAVEMKAQHSLLDQILGVFPRATLASQEFQQAFEMCGAGCHWFVQPLPETLGNCLNDRHRRSGAPSPSRSSLDEKQRCREGPSPQYGLACREFQEPSR